MAKRKREKIIKRKATSWLLALIWVAFIAAFLTAAFCMIDLLHNDLQAVQKAIEDIGRDMLLLFLPFTVTVFAVLIVYFLIKNIILFFPAALMVIFFIIVLALMTHNAKGGKYSYKYKQSRSRAVASAVLMFVLAAFFIFYFAFGLNFIESWFTEAGNELLITPLYRQYNLIAGIVCAVIAALCLADKNAGARKAVADGVLSEEEEAEIKRKEYELLKEQREQEQKAFTQSGGQNPFFNTTQTLAPKNKKDK